MALGDAAPQRAGERLRRLMTAVAPEADWHTESLGVVTRRILRGRSQVIGELLDCVVTCPSCEEQMSIEVTVAELCGADLDDTEPDTVQITRGGITVVARPLTPADLDAAAGAASLDAARWKLIERCVLAVSPDVPVSDLEPELIAAIGCGIDEADPLVDPMLALVCPECDTGFVAGLDVTSFVYNELAARGSRLLYEVDALAQRYGWSESEILALSPERRARYVELVG